MLLELAIQFFKNAIPNRSTVRFAWWGAEEIGLFGSRHYVRTIKTNATAFNNIALYINFDMMGSPNFVAQVHDSYIVSVPVTDVIMDASYQVQRLLETFFQKEELPYQLDPMAGGSDYLPFIEAGIPSNGLATGAGLLKTEQERLEFGGFANAPHDPCYHQYCDTVENVSREALRQCSQSAGTALEALAVMPNLREYLYTPQKPATR